MWMSLLVLLENEHQRWGRALVCFLPILVHFSYFEVFVVIQFDNCVKVIYIELFYVVVIVVIAVETGCKWAFADLRH